MRNLSILFIALLGAMFAAACSDGQQGGESQATGGEGESTSLSVDTEEGSVSYESDDTSVSVDAEDDENEGN